MHPLERAIIALGKSGRVPLNKTSDYGDGSRAEGVKCKCGEYKVFTTDAIGRVRERCPRCQGVAPPRKLIAGERPALQALPELIILPKIEAGQLRCQRCARGVDSDRRFCKDCKQKTGRRPGFRLTEAARANLSALAKARHQRLREARGL